MKSDSRYQHCIIDKLCEAEFVIQYSSEELQDANQGTRNAGLIPGPPNSANSSFLHIPFFAANERRSVAAPIPKVWGKRGDKCFAGFLNVKHYFSTQPLLPSNLCRVSGSTLDPLAALRSSLHSIRNAFSTTLLSRCEGVYTEYLEGESPSLDCRSMSLIENSNPSFSPEPSHPPPAAMKSTKCSPPPPKPSQI